jgi:hypothetical protein
MERDDIPAGLCQCGCGQRTTVAPMTSRAQGYVKYQGFLAHRVFYVAFKGPIRGDLVLDHVAATALA